MDVERARSFSIVSKVLAAKIGEQRPMSMVRRIQHALESSAGF